MGKQKKKAKKAPKRKGKFEKIIEETVKSTRRRAAKPRQSKKAVGRKKTTAPSVRKKKPAATRAKKVAKRRRRVVKPKEAIEERPFVYAPKAVEVEERPLIKTELPVEYGDTRLVLMVRDPEWVFAYWEIKPELRSQLGLEPLEAGKKLVLRFYDITEFPTPEAVPPDSQFDVEVNYEPRNWYVRVPQVGRSWIADLGMIELRGKEPVFVVIARSNVVTTPRAALAPPAEEREGVARVEISKYYRKL